MKDFISFALLVAASPGGGAADSSRTPREVLAALAASLNLRAGDDFDFDGALACATDPSTGDAADEAGCATAADAGGAPCAWCDVSRLLGDGEGACASSELKSRAGRYWDYLCEDDDAEPEPESGVLATLSSLLRHRDGDDVDLAGALACTADLSTGEVTEEAGCATATDQDGAPCVWCDASVVLEGACVSADVRSMASEMWVQFCRDDEPEPAPPVFEDGDGGGGFPEALGCMFDAWFRLIVDEASCVARTDPTSDAGERCVWCGGACVTNAQGCSGEEG